MPDQCCTCYWGVHSLLSGYSPSDRSCCNWRRKAFCACGGLGPGGKNAGWAEPSKKNGVTMFDQRKSWFSWFSSSTFWGFLICSFWMWAKNKGLHWLHGIRMRLEWDCWVLDPPKKLKNIISNTLFQHVETEETKPGQKRKDSGFQISGPYRWSHNPGDPGREVARPYLVLPAEICANTNIHKAQCHICIYIIN